MSPAATAHLADVASFVRGITFKPDDVVPVGSEGSVACMRTKNVQADLDLSDVWGIPASFVKRDNQYLQAGDLLVSSANSWNLVGKCCWVPELPWRATFGGFISVLRGNRERIEPRYLYHWFSSPRIQATVRSFGQQTTNISNLNFERCLRLPIPLPPLPEQRRIAEILDKADALRAKRRAALAQLDTLSQSIFLDMFGDPATNPKGYVTRSLTAVCNCYSGGTPSKRESRYWTGGLPWFSPKDLKHDDLFDSEDHINELVLSETSLKLLPPNAVVIVVRGMILAHTFPVSVIRVPATINQDLKALLPKDSIELDAQFLANCLRAQSRAVLASVSESAHGTKRLDAEALANIAVVLPPSKLQQEFARRVAKTEESKAALHASLRQLDSLFASLQERAFRRNLRTDSGELLGNAYAFGR